MHGFMIPTVLIVILAACVLLPLWFKHRLYLKQLDTISRAIEKGVNPELIKESLAMPRRNGDINGNWKAGVILIGVGVTLFLLGLPKALSEGSLDWLIVLVFVVLGIILMHIHRTVVGKVVKAGEEGLLNHNGNGS